MFGKITTVVTSAVLMVMLSSSAALAHFCFNASRSTTGTHGAAASPAWLSMHELLHLLVDEGEFPPLCDGQIGYVVETVDPDGAFATHAKVVVASGTLNTNPNLTGNNRGIDHVFPGHPELEAAVMAAVGAALANPSLCD